VTFQFVAKYLKLHHRMPTSDVVTYVTVGRFNKCRLFVLCKVAAVEEKHKMIVCNSKFGVKQ